jgi:glycosyltransferase involved in cell wall biosynthesis
MACDGVGPSFTAFKLMEGAHAAGYPVRIYVNRSRMPASPLPLHAALPGLLGQLPYRKVEAFASRRLEARYARDLRPGDIAYLFPSASLEIHEILHRRGIPIVLEGINTRMSSARTILDAAYDAFGAAPAHGITDARIAEEEAKYALATTIFAPSRPVEAALTGSPLERSFIPASYGVDTRLPTPERRYETPERPLTFLFCGYASVRKGTHHLLDAFARLGGESRLRLVGRIEPVIAARYASLLNDSRVETIGFVRDVHPHFAKADVFVMPSLEEGDPLVTYEAALHSLPIIASPMGAGRMGDVPGRITIVPPGEIEALTQAMADLAASTERRAELGGGIRRAVQEYDWQRIGAARAAALEQMF